jgi:hypothetical protein
MGWHRVLGLAAFGLVGGLVAACSSSNSGTGDGGTILITHDDSGGPGLGDANTCAPADESKFKPTWHPPRPPSGACTQAQIDSFITCLRDQDANPSATPPSCQPWAPATPQNTACDACIFSKSSDGMWGPIVENAQKILETNPAGCFAIAEKATDGSGCGGNVNAANECVDSACNANCPVDSQGNGFTALQQCVSDAQAGTCATFQTAADNCANGDAGAISICFPTTQTSDSFADQAAAIIPVFCGAGASDGGTSDAGGNDSGTDSGPTDSGPSDTGPG